MSRKLPVVSHYEVVIVRENLAGFVSHAGGGAGGGPLSNRTRETIGVVAGQALAFYQSGFITAQKGIKGVDALHEIMVSTTGIHSVEFIPVLIED